MGFTVSNPNPGGGSAISLPLQAWIETSANAGNDTTGTVGDPSKPYATIAAAITAGARMLNLGAGTFAGYDDDFGAALDLAFRGLGPTRSIVTTLRNRGRALTVRDLGVESVMFTTLSTEPSPGGTGESGHYASALTVQNVVAGTVSANGGTAGNGAEPVSDGPPGGNAGTVNIIGSLRATAVQANGGNAGQAVTDGFSSPSGGNGGNAGSVTSSVMALLIAGSVDCNSGSPSSGQMGGSDGSYGAPGNVTNLTVDVASMSICGADGGYLSVVSGSIGSCSMQPSSSSGNNGNLTACHFLSIGNLSASETAMTPSSEGSHIYIGSTGGPAPSGTLPCSVINGVPT